MNDINKTYNHVHVLDSDLSGICHLHVVQRTATLHGNCVSQETLKQAGVFIYCAIRVIENVIFLTFFGTH